MKRGNLRTFVEKKEKCQRTTELSNFLEKKFEDK